MTTAPAQCAGQQTERRRHIGAPVRLLRRPPPGIRAGDAGLQRRLGDGPGAYQLATPGGSVDLRAQVIDSTSGTYTYSWNTTGLADANTIAGTSTYDLTFKWNTTISTAHGRDGDAHRDRPQPEPGKPDLHLLDAGGDRIGHRRDDVE